VQNGRRGFIDWNGNLIDSLRFLGIQVISSGYFEVESPQQLYGICDSTGKTVIRPQYEKIKFYDGAFAAVKKNDRYAFIDGKGKVLTNFKFEKVKEVSGDNVIVRVGGLYGVVNKLGQEIVRTIYEGYELDSTGINLYLEGTWYTLDEIKD
jgi:uncharacterized ion transporter superfamily protein YfcC